MKWNEYYVFDLDYKMIQMIQNESISLCSTKSLSFILFSLCFFLLKYSLIICLHSRYTLTIINYFYLCFFLLQFLFITKNLYHHSKINYWYFFHFYFFTKNKIISQKFIILSSIYKIIPYLRWSRYKAFTKKKQIVNKNKHNKGDKKLDIYTY